MQIHAKLAKPEPGWIDPSPSEAIANASRFDYSKVEPKRSGGVSAGRTQDTTAEVPLRSSFDFEYDRQGFDFRNTQLKPGQRQLGEDGEQDKILDRFVQAGGGRSFARSSVGGAAGGGPKNKTVTDEVTTKLLVAVSDRLWQHVLHGSTAKVIAHPVELTSGGGMRSETQDCHDYDTFAKSLYLIKDEVDESPKRRPRDNGPVTVNSRAFFGTRPPRSPLNARCQQPCTGQHSCVCGPSACHEHTCMREKLWKELTSQ